LSAITTSAGGAGQQVGERLVLFLVGRDDRVSKRQAVLVGEQDESDAVDEAVLRLGEAEAGEAGELAATLTAGVVGDADQGAVAEPDAAAVEQAGESLLHDRDQLDEHPQASVVLRLVGQVREPARQHTTDQAEELPVGADPDRRLRDRKRDQFGIADQRPPASSRRDRIVVSEDVGCNDKGFQIRHLELQSRGDTGLEALLRHAAGPCEPAAVSHQPSSNRGANHLLWVKSFEARVWVTPGYRKPDSG
jgi:hypothetical protein